MTLWKRGKHVGIEQEEEEIEVLLREIQEARLQWMTAQNRLDFVVEPDEIEYAIFALEAAEKKYGILLRQAKKLNVCWDEYMTGSVRRTERPNGTNAGENMTDSAKTQAGEWK